MTSNPFTHRAPDPARAHGAWVYLGTSVLAGVLAAAPNGAVSALCAGFAFVGVFLIASAFARYPLAWGARLAAGLVLAAGGTGLGLLLGADPTFLAYASIALFPAAGSVWFATRHGYQSPPALAFAVVTLVVAAPAAACAGGAPPRLGWILLGLLAPFFAWRTWSTRRKLSERKWTRPQLRKLGLTEALLAALWTALAVTLIHAL